MTWLRFALLAVDRTVGEIIFLLQKMEPPIWNKPPIWNTFAVDRVIFRIGVFTVPSKFAYLPFLPPARKTQIATKSSK